MTLRKLLLALILTWISVASARADWLPTFSGDVSNAGPGSPLLTIANGAVTSGKMAPGAAACNPPTAAAPLTSVVCQGAVADEQDASAETVTLSGYNLSASPGIFAASDVGKTIYVEGAGATPTSGYIQSIVSTPGAGYQSLPAVALSGSPTTQAYPGVVMIVVTVTQTGAGTGCPNGPFTNVQLGVAHTPQTVPTVSGTIAGGVMTAVSLSVAGEWLNDYPTANSIPALTGVPVALAGCATYPTVTISLGVKIAFGAAYHGTSRGAGYPTSGVTATFSGGSPTTAATPGAVVVGTWTPPLKSTISAYISPTSVTLANSPGTALAAQIENIRWGTDDTSFVQAAANIAKAVYFPPGKGCYMFDEITISSNTKFYGDGPGSGACVALAGNSYNPMFYGSAVANVTIEGLYAKGNNDLFITNASGSAFADFEPGSSNVRVMKNDIRKWGRHCVKLEGVTNGWADDNYIDGCEFGRGISLSVSVPSYNVHASRNIVKNTQWASIGALDVDVALIDGNISGGSNQGWGDSTYGLTEDCFTFYSADPTNAWITFTDNTGANCGNNAAHLGFDHGVIARNTFQNYTLYGLVVARAPNEDPAQAFDVKVDDNHLLGSNRLSQGRGDGITIRNLYGGTAEGNVCDTVYNCLYLAADGAYTGNRALNISGNDAINVYHFLEAENKLIDSYIGQNVGDNVDSDFILFGNYQVIGNTSFPEYFNHVGLNKITNVDGYAFNEVSGNDNLVDGQNVTGSAGGAVAISGAGSYARDVASPVTATGTNQATAAPLNYQYNVISSCASGTGVVLVATPSSGAVATSGSTRTTVTNQSGSACLIYPPSNDNINALSTNAAYSLSAGATLDFVQFSPTQWYTH